MATDRSSTPRTGLTLAIIGCGVMGTAILQGVLDACPKERTTGEKPRFSKVIACVNSEASVERLKKAFMHEERLEILQKGNVKGANAADVVMLGCKPYMVQDILGEDGILAALEEKLLISFVVGTPQAKILNCLRKGTSNHPNDKALKKNPKIVRGMMNLAAQYGESLTIIEDLPLPGDFLDIVNWIFSQLGKTTLVAPNLYDVGGVIAGASSAFLSVAIDGMLDGAVCEGIKRSEGRKMLTQTLRSLAALLENGETPDTVREKVSSPKGTTIAGTMSLEEDGVRASYSKAIVKAANRSRDI
ncbi:pyrroline-5-carboxylate reductase dimerization-domain-containing protein [Calycina marina]|uniref:Pyrroline-5-carboxylate reductase dimerization-domain-containing protein n=1 Tax=Calycina marina TaxID=1763456 RepID=A0A9P7YYA6_9HELO|nr:pyrroline-5-carboxylate reductase dimerization-domain-containing protein [Calycina marina]